MNHSIKEFFEKHILPLHQKQNSGTTKFLNQAFRTEEASYFSEPLHPDYLYLTTIPLESEAACKAYLHKFWQDDPALIKLVPDLVKLAFKLKEESIEQTTELSPFVYTMF